MYETTYADREASFFDSCVFTFTDMLDQTSRHPHARNESEETRNPFQQNHVTGMPAWPLVDERAAKRYGNSAAR